MLEGLKQQEKEKEKDSNETYGHSIDNIEASGNESVVFSRHPTAWRMPGGQRLLANIGRRSGPGVLSSLHLGEYRRPSLDGGKSLYICANTGGKVFLKPNPAPVSHTPIA